MIKGLHIGVSPLTNRIFAGRVSKDGTCWLAGKVDVTGPACGAVAEHVIANGAPVVVNCNGKPAFRLSVEIIEAADQGNGESSHG